MLIDWSLEGRVMSERCLTDPTSFEAFVSGYIRNTSSFENHEGRGSLSVVVQTVKTTKRLGQPPSLAVAIFKVKDGKVVEHWDVMEEEVPASATASGNPMLRRLAGPF